MENKIRQYILEKPDTPTQVSQYIQVMKAFLYRLLENVSKVKLSSEEKSFLEKQVVDLIKNRKDYSRSSDKNKLFTAFQIPFKEGLLSPEKLIASPESKGILARIAHSLGNISKKDISPENVKSMGYKAGIAVLLIAVSVGILKLAKRIRQSAEVRRILDEDVNPSVIEMAKSIIRGNLKDTGKIDSYLNQIEMGVYNKYQFV